MVVDYDLGGASATDPINSHNKAPDLVLCTIYIEPVANTSAVSLYNDKASDLDTEPFPSTLAVGLNYFEKKKTQ